ncbi:MAG: ketoacyl-ACP synthase III [Bacteroidetes bacterium]|nr:MAG: ketoacyl-ACP synthase III [Bacteroidota bacterium]
MRNATLLSTGMHVPDWVLPNAYFDQMLGEDVSTWLEEFAQIYERRWCREDEAVLDLCLGAAQQALTRAGLPAEGLDLIIVATDTPEYVSPSTASVLQHKLGASRAGSFDLNTACAGFVTGLELGANMIRAQKRYQHVLVIGAYAMSKYLDKTDKKTVTLFADGAGAVILKAEETADRGYLAGHLSTQGQYYDGMGIYGGATRIPMTQEVLDRGDHLLRFVYRFPRDLNQVEWTRVIHELSRQAGVQPQEVDHFFITQINVHAIHDTLAGLGVPPERAHTIMHHYGYTGSACIPMALNDAVEKKAIKRGDLLMFVGSGGGLAFAGAAFRY